MLAGGLGILRDVHFLGFLSATEAPAAYASSHCFCIRAKYRQTRPGRRAELGLEAMRPGCQWRRTRARVEFRSG